MPAAPEDTGMHPVPSSIAAPSTALLRIALLCQIFMRAQSARRANLVLQGADCVSAYVTHGVFPNESWRRFTKCNGTADAFRFFWITDSCPRTVQALEGQAPYEIISLAGPIMAALQI